MKRSTSIMVIGIITLGIAGGVYAYGGHQGWKMSPEKKAEYVMDMMSENLELNASQQDNLRAASGQMIGIMKEIRSERKERKALMQELLSEPTLDQAKALQMIRQKTQLIDQKAPEVIASIAGFLDSLDAEQKRELSEQLTRHMGKRHRHHKHQ